MFFGVFLCVLSRIFFNPAPRSPKVGKKSLLIIDVGRNFSESHYLVLLIVVVCWFVVPNVTKQVFVHFLC